MPCVQTQRRGYGAVAPFKRVERKCSRQRIIRDMDQNRTRIIPCPACGKMTQYGKNPYRPFCSRACKGVDFIHWTDGEYRIAKDDQDEDSSVMRERE